MNTSFLDAAQSEFDDAIYYYDEGRPGLGSEFAQEVEEALERIIIILKLGLDCRRECGVV